MRKENVSLLLNAVELSDSQMKSVLGGDEDAESVNCSSLSKAQCGGKCQHGGTCYWSKKNTSESCKCAFGTVGTIDDGTLAD